MKTLRIFFLLSLLCLASCGRGPKATYRIGVDPSFYPLELDGKEPNVFAFTNELLVEIGKLKRIDFERVNMSWDNLLWGLGQKKYAGMISSMEPYVFNLQKYSFSDLMMKTGPVLVTREDFPIDSFRDLDHKIVAVEDFNGEKLLLSKSPGSLVRMYASETKALNDLLNEKYDAIFIDVVPAISYIRDLYEGKLKIVTPPLTNEGLRLITLHESAPDLIQAFNEGLEELEANGTLKALLKKWNVGMTQPPSKL